MPYAPVNGVSLYYQETGEGLPILLGHGGWSDITEWDPQVAPLASQYRVIRYDRRGCGRSTPREVEHTAEAWVEDLYQLIHYLNLESPVVGGVSWGGMLTLELLVRHPQVARAAIIVSATAGGFPGKPGYNVPFPNRLEELRAVDIPVLVVHGKEDDLYPLPHGEAMVRHLPNAQLVALGGGHTVNNEAIEPFNQAMLQFLERVTEDR